MRMLRCGWDGMTCRGGECHCGWGPDLCGRGQMDLSCGQ